MLAVFGIAFAFSMVDFFIGLQDVSSCAHRPTAASNYFQRPTNANLLQF